jgi:hypothetical protein
MTYGDISADPSIANVDLTSDYCWGNWATNASMAGSLAPFFAARPWGGLSVSATGLLNGITGTIASQKFTGAPAGYSNYDPTWVTALGLLLSNEWVKDTTTLETAFLLRAVIDPNGVSNAQLVDPLGSPLSMMGVPPNYPLNPNSDPSAPPTYYSDVDSPRGAEADFPNDYLTRRMFWRSHLPETCSETPISTLSALRNRCDASAANGGDPDACTACVEAVESHVPTCGAPTTAGGQKMFGPSKCMAVNAESGGMPASWSDPTSRWGTLPDYGTCLSPNLVAIEFCTGTVGAVNINSSPGVPADQQGPTNAQDPGGAPLVGDRDYMLELAGLDEQVQSQCLASLPDPNAPAPNFATVHVSKSYRIALVHSEGDPNSPTPDVLVNAFDTTTKESEQSLGMMNGLAECELLTTSTAETDIAQQSLGTLPLESDVQHTAYQFYYPSGAFDLGIQYCGTTRRYTLWNRTCKDVLGQFPQLRSGGIDLQQPPGLFGGTEAGYQDFTLPGGEQRCAMLEKPPPYDRTSSCRGGTYCNSSDLCVPAVRNAPPIRYLSWW